MTHRGGVTLAEAVVAIGILVAGFMVAATLYNRSLQYSSTIERRARAALAAQEALAQVRNQARDPAVFRAGLPARSGPHPEWPDLDVAVQVERLYGEDRVTSPSRTLEALFPPADRRTLGSSALKAQVRVTWPGSSPQGLTLVSLLAEPPRVVAPARAVAIDPSPAPDPIPFAGVTLTASLLDADDDPVEDLSFRWYVTPKTTSGRITPQDRMGQSALLEPVYESLRGTVEPSPPGECTVEVRAVYNGQEHWGSLEVRL